MNMSLALGIDLGGTKTVVGVVDRTGTIVREMEYPTIHEPLPKIQSQLAQSIHNVAHEFIADKSLRSVGVSIGGYGDRESIITWAPHTPEWQGHHLGHFIRSVTGLPVTRIINDANAALYGEIRAWAGTVPESALYFTVSTGIGGALWSGGQIVMNEGTAGEFGHLIVQPDGITCACGRRGCLEAYSSGSGIRRRIQTLRKEVVQSINASIGHADNDPVSARDLLQAVQQRHPDAQALWQEAIAYLAVAVSNLLGAFAPAVVIVGGGLSQAQDMFFSPLRKQVAERRLPLGREVAIVPGRLRARASLVGAARWALDWAGENQ